MSRSMSRDRSAAQLEAASEPIVVLERNGSISALNPAARELFGHRRVGSSLRIDRLPLDDESRAALAAAVRELAIDGRSETRSLRLIARPPDGGARILQVKLTRSSDSRGQFVIGALRDVTDLTLIETELVGSRRLAMVGGLAAGIAHEINTPIQYIGDNLSFQQDGAEALLTLVALGEAVCSAPDGDARTAAVDAFRAHAEEIDLGFIAAELPLALKQSLEGIDHVTNIVAAMRDYSHPSLEEFGTVDLARCVRDTIVLAKNTWKHVADVTTELDPAITSIPGRPSELNQVVLNLLINAVHAIEAVPDRTQNGRIVISTELQGDRVELAVADTGAGIPVEARPRIFHRFFTTKGRGKGTGQGLAICQAVVRKMKGTIEFDSQLGRGTVFRISLPARLPSEESRW